MPWAACFGGLLIIEWMALHLMGKMILEPSRHLLSWTPLFCIMIFFIMNKFKAKSILAMMTLVIIIPATWANWNNLESKSEVYDRELIDQNDAKMILGYGATLEHLLYSWKQKEAYVIEFKSFYENLDKIQFPDKILLVSSSIDFDAYKEQGSLRSDVAKIVERYDIKNLAEVNTDISLMHNNKGYVAGKKVFYLYELNLKEHLLK